MAALLYGDWGTSKAYVIGLAFLAAGFSSLPIILAVCGVTALVGINYIVICRHFPDGGVALWRLGNQQGVCDWPRVSRRWIFISTNHSRSLRRHRPRRDQLHRDLPPLSR